MKIYLAQEFTKHAHFQYGQGKVLLHHAKSGQGVMFDSVKEAMSVLRDELGLTKWQFMVMLWYVVIEGKYDSPAYEVAVQNIIHRKLMSA